MIQLFLVHSWYEKLDQVLSHDAYCDRKNVDSEAWNSKSSSEEIVVHVAALAD